MNDFLLKSKAFKTRFGSAVYCIPYIINPYVANSPSGSSINTPLSGKLPCTLNCSVTGERDVYNKISENYKTNILKVFISQSNYQSLPKRTFVVGILS